MTVRLITLALVLLWSVPSLGADCDAVDVRRNNQGFTIQRIKLADGKTTNTTSTKCVPPSLSPTGNQAATPWDFYAVVADEGSTGGCTDWDATVRTYPMNVATTVCREACDAHSLVTLEKTGVTTKFYQDPLGEAFDVVTANVNCPAGVNIYLDLYWRNQNR